MQNQKNEYKQILGDKNINDYIDAPNKTVNINRKFIQKPKRVKLFDLK